MAGSHVNEFEVTHANNLLVLMLLLEILLSRGLVGDENSDFPVQVCGAYFRRISAVPGDPCRLFVPYGPHRTPEENSINNYDRLFGLLTAVYEKPFRL